MRDIRKKWVDAETVTTGNELDAAPEDIAQVSSSAVIAKWNGNSDGDIELQVGVDENSLVPYEAATSMGGANGQKMWNLKDEPFSLVKVITKNTTTGSSDVDVWLCGKP